ncbi:hypothetical protein [Promicromonospora sukumoe]
MRRALISTTSLALSLVLVGAGAGTATAAESPSPSPSPSVSVSPTPTPTPSPSVSEPEDETGGEPEDEVAPQAKYTFPEAPTYTCDADPTDDFQLPADSEAVTYTLDGGNYVATLSEGYEWGEQPNPDPDYDQYEATPGFAYPFTGPTDPVVMPVADMAFPNCNHDDETQVSVSTECTDGLGYLVYDIDAPWAPADSNGVTVVGNTGDETAHGRSYRDVGLSGSLAWDGSSPGGEHAFEFDQVFKPIFFIEVEKADGTHNATVKLNDFIAEDPCLDAAPGDGEGGGSAGADDEELAATGPEAAWITAGVAALLVAAGVALVVARRRMSA